MSAGDSRVVVITTAELAPGFRLAGVEAHAPSSLPAAAQRLRELLRDPEVGVVGVHERWLEELPDDLARRARASSMPVVVALPDGAEMDDAATRRARLVEAVQRAVGFRIDLGPQEQAR